jgi:hypothetical protein
MFWIGWLLLAVRNKLGCRINMRGVVTAVEGRRRSTLDALFAGNGRRSPPYGIYFV